jgi:heterodisulfide reductase subunit A-like polyferredoxin
MLNISMGRVNLLMSAFACPTRAGCLTCVCTCPFGIPQIRADLTSVGGLRGAAWIDPARCQGCGTCTAECPAKAIQLLGYRDEQIMSGVGAWEVREAVGIPT